MADDVGGELQLIYLFVHLVNAGSFSQAAKDLDMPIATVSRKLAKLEEKLDKQLFMRSTRKLRLTEDCGLRRRFRLFQLFLFAH